MVRSIESHGRHYLLNGINNVIIFGRIFSLANVLSVTISILKILDLGTLSRMYMDIALM